jgi:hypothetical protein
MTRPGLEFLRYNMSENIYFIFNVDNYLHILDYYKPKQKMLNRFEVYPTACLIFRPTLATRTEVCRNCIWFRCWFQMQGRNDRQSIGVCQHARSKAVYRIGQEA